MFFAAGLTSYFDRPVQRPAWVRAIHDATRVLALLHLLIVVLVPPRSDLWATVGIVLYTTAVAIFLAAIETARRTRLQRAFIDQPLPDRLITDGPFRWVRHPFYTGYICGAVAGPIAVKSATLVVLAAIMSTITISAAFREERVWLASPRAEAYRQYQRRTGMFLPLLGRG